MARLIHYMIPANSPRGNSDTYDHYNIEIGGYGPLSQKGIDLVKRRICKEQELSYTKRIIICNIMDVAEEGCPMTPEDHYHAR